MALHKNLGLANNHFIHNWEVANATARDLLSVASTDIGKVALQADTLRFYVLCNNVGPIWKDLNAVDYDDSDTLDIPLTGLSLVDSSDVDATDSILEAIGKLQTRNNIAKKYLPIAVSDQSTPLVAGTNVIDFRLPYDLQLTGLKASLKTAQTSGTVLTIDVNVNGVSILSTKLAFDNGETTTKTASTPFVLSAGTFLEDDLVTIDIDAVGDGTAVGLKLYFSGV